MGWKETGISSRLFVALGYAALLGCLLFGLFDLLLAFLQLASGQKLATPSVTYCPLYQAFFFLLLLFNN